MTKLTGQQIAAEKLDGWAYLIDSLRTRITTPDFATGLALVNAIGAAAEEMDHHPDVDLRYTTVAIRLTSHDTGGVTARDVRLARWIDALAAAAGLSTAREETAQLEIGLDTPHQPGIDGFWAAVLGTSLAGDEVRDPRGVLPTVWFQHSGDEEPRQRWHFDLWLDPAQVQPRIDAAVAAGGTVVSDANAPAFWVLADAEGNRMCICTWQERG
ncbi:4a-hydroxytetrahydrobiopterin dehydratase [Actinoplanes sp. TBRC 11911]|uniref:4a-hydroxytetrahydrobiopterin dehydratase n=1 Tax=Actinoplanes sp. TBRC 11911 TaxID=2729386 RepID=UPI00145E4BCF|nr:4a-hydroxytetrahydrobiopterin dehydratase [Actinoplanes sp. TBRC 11911]NMO51213.1 4a-hydroxytetrahydrobiopterin dehydratase [Actinoplanes sp. TBRC 11911]